MQTVECATVKEAVQRSGVADGTAGRALLFAVDVGATNTRLALTLDFTRVFFVKVKADSAANVAASIVEFWKAVAESYPTWRPRVAAAAIAVPGPVTDGSYAVIANFKGDTTEARTLRRDTLTAACEALCPRGRTLLLNDLESAAMGIAGLDRAALLSPTFVEAWPGTVADGKSLRNGRVVVVAPGTGLGCALILHEAASKGAAEQGGAYKVIPLEFGHTPVPSQPEGSPHARVLRAFGKKLGRDVEYDDVCSGRGLQQAFATLSSTESSPEAAEIASRASNGDAAALAALQVHYDFTLIFAANLTMGFMATHVVLAGDNVVANSAFLRKANDRLRRTMLSHSMERLGFMSRAAVLKQTAFVNLNLIGAAFAANSTANAAARLVANAKL